MHIISIRLIYAGIVLLFLIIMAGIAGADEVNVAVNGTDATPPDSIANLEETDVGSNWITWKWYNSYDADFSHVIIYIDGAFAANTSDGFYNSTGLTEGVHTISTKTVDNAGNINPTWVNDSASTATVDVNLVSRFGGPISDVAVSGDYAYVGRGKDFVVLGMTNVNKPPEMGRIIMPSEVTGIAVEGNHAYVTTGSFYETSVNGSTGLFIIDITDPSTPKIEGRYATANAQSVDISGHYAYVGGDMDGLLIVDITDSAAPMLVGSYATLGGAWDLDISGNYAYVAAGWNGLMILNISDPSAPALAGSYATHSRHGRAWGVDISGNYAYVADSWDGLIILNISDPSAPALAGSYYTGDAYDVAIAGNYAYVSHFFSGSYENYSEEYAGFAILNISNSSSPTLVGRYDTTSGIFLSDIVIAGNYAYVNAGAIYDYDFLVGTVGLLIVDISNPSKPILAGSYDTASWVWGVDISGNYAYISNVDNLMIVDITDPASPKSAGSYDSTLSDVTVVDNYAYLAAGENGLRIVDISDPYAPALVGSYDTAGNAENVAVSSNYAYVSDNEDGLLIVDITDPSAPTLAGSYNTDDYASIVAVASGYAYVVTGDGLAIVDISNPSAPILAGKYNIVSAEDIAVAGNYAYIAAGDNGLVIMDITNPSAPAFAGSYDTNGYANAVAVAGNYAYVADDWNGFVILDIINPSGPAFAGKYNIGSASALDVAVAGNYAYIAGWVTGLSILNVEKPAEKTPGFGSVLALSAIGGALLVLRKR